MKIVIIGGTGLIGSKVAEKLKRFGHEPVVAAPSTGVNTVTGEGLAAVLASADVVVDVANSPSFDDDAAMQFFQTAGRNLVAAEMVAGVKLHVGLSVVGTERLLDSGYFRAKLVQEHLIKNSPIPYTLVHATQFFEFLRPIAQFSGDDKTVYLPPVMFRPIAGEDVAEAVTKAALSEPLNDTIEIAGPDMFTLDEAIRKTLEFDHDPRTVITEPDAPYFGVRVSDTTLVPKSDAHLGAINLSSWLANVPAPSANS